MKCAEAKLMFSPYLDGAVTGTQMHSLSRHLAGCSNCNREYALLRRTQEMLATVKRQKAPADLQLKLRLAISREVALARHSRLQGFFLRLENAMRAFMVPATAGLVVAEIISGNRERRGAILVAGQSIDRVLYATEVEKSRPGRWTTPNDL